MFANYPSVTELISKIYKEAKNEASEKIHDAFINGPWNYIRCFKEYR